MTPVALEEAKRIAHKVTAALGGCSIFGVELFVKSDKVWFSEVSPRPHDTLGLLPLHRNSRANLNYMHVPF